MGVEFSCCSTEVPSHPLPPTRHPYSSDPIYDPGSKSRPASPLEGSESDFPYMRMRKSSMDTRDEVREFRALSRMYSSKKHQSIGKRRICSLMIGNPFEVSQSSIDKGSDVLSLDFTIPISEEHSRSQSRCEQASLRPEYDYHSPPKWFNEMQDLVSLVSLSESSAKFIAIAHRIQNSLNVSVTKVEKVRNVPLYRGFADTHEDCSRMEGSSQQILELFYGTGKIDPYTLCTNSTGLDSASIQVFDQPMTCFADAAKDSFKFSFRRKDGSRQLLLCLVTVGEAVELLPDEDVNEPPARLGRSTPVLSAKLRKKKSNIWIVYEKKMSYPAYIITLKEEPKTKAK